jgi:hypothetical protein
MKKLSSLLFGISLLLISVYFISCEKCDTKGTKLSIKSINAEFVKITGITVSLDNNMYFETKNIILDTIGIDYDSLGVFVYNDIQTYARNYSIKLINSAYACDPVFEFKGIDSLYIYSDVDYDAQHPKGSNLRGIMGFRNNTSFENESEKNVQGSLALLNFNTSPSQNAFHTLTIKYKLVDGNMVSYTLPRVKILK